MKTHAFDEEVDLIFRKLEPYLKKGLSLHKACLEAKIPSSRTGANDLEPLLESILTHWKPLNIDYTSLILNQINATKAQTNAGELYY